MGSGAILGLGNPPEKASGSLLWADFEIFFGPQDGKTRLQGDTRENVRKIRVQEPPKEFENGVRRGF